MAAIRPLNADVAGAAAVDLGAAVTHHGGGWRGKAQDMIDLTHDVERASERTSLSHCTQASWLPSTTLHRASERTHVSLSLHAPAACRPVPCRRERGVVCGLRDRLRAHRIR